MHLSFAYRTPLSAVHARAIRWLLRQHPGLHGDAAHAEYPEHDRGQGVERGPRLAGTLGGGGDRHPGGGRAAAVHASGENLFGIHRR